VRQQLLYRSDDPIGFLRRVLDDCADDLWVRFVDNRAIISRQRRHFARDVQVEAVSSKFSSIVYLAIDLEVSQPILFR
jgi:hypothetical protein